jgi:hypothetical protein
VSRLVVEDADICDFATAIVEFDADAAAPASPRGPTDTTQLRGAVEALVIEADDSEVARLAARQPLNHPMISTSVSGVPALIR